MSKVSFDITVNDQIVQRCSVHPTTGAKNITISDDPAAFEDTDFSTILNIHTTKAGFAFPTMTTAQMDAIADPKVGLIILNITEVKPYIYTGANLLGWYPLSGVKLPITTTLNGIATWSNTFGRALANNHVTIDNSGNMTFPANATLDLSNDGTLKANIIDAYTIKCQALVAETSVEIKQLTTTTFNADHATVNSLVVNNGFDLSAATVTAAALNLNINGRTSTVPGFTATGSAATAGTAALNGASGIVIDTTAVSANSIISVTRNIGVGAPSDVTTIGNLMVGSIISGTSFTVYSTVTNDTGNFNWLIINP